jgi:hypothetical protein
MIESQNAPITKDISFESYQSICRDIRNQPKWRLDSDTDADYYDGAQTSVEVVQRLKDAGIPPQDSNLIKPTINAVLGIEARSRTDYKVTSDDEQQAEIAEGLSAKIKEIETESRADRAMSDAYSSMIRAGVGWVEVSRAFNPLEYPYRVREVHRNEIFWDWTAREPDLSDARYLRRDSWKDRQSVLAMFPEQKALIDNTWSGWNTMDVYDGTDTNMARAYEVEQAWGQQQEDYLNNSSGMVRLSELWYRYYEQAPVIMLPDGRGLEYDPQNIYHQAAVARGVVQVQKALLPRVRVSIWLGPHKLMDVPTPLPHGNFPYVPFWCFRKDRIRTPYGLIRDMRGPQDQIIDLDILLYELLNSKRIEIDNDALDLTQNTYQEVAHNVASPRSVTILNAQRRNADGFRVTTDHALAAAVYQLVEERRGRIEAVSGVYRAMLGKETTADSGVAINSLVEQGSTVLAEPNDNFRYSRRLVGEMLIAFAKSDMIGRPTQISVQQGAKKKVIYINREVMTPQGPVIQNDIASAQIKVVLEDIPATPSFRAQQLQSLSQMVQVAPPQYQAVLYPMMIELSDVPNRHETADLLRKVGGVPGPMTPEQEAQQQQMAQLQQQLQMKAIQLGMAEKEAQIAKLQAEVQKIASDAQAQQQTMQLQAQIEDLKAQVAQAEIQLKDKALELQAIKIHADATIGAEKVSIAERQMALDEKTAAAVLADPAAKSENQTRS